MPVRKVPISRPVKLQSAGHKTCNQPGTGGRIGRNENEYALSSICRQASWSEKDIRFYHFRDKDNFEVDIVLERGAYEIAGAEVKASATVTGADFRGLRKLRDTAKNRFISGIVL